MHLFATINPLTFPLPVLFGSGAPGWLARDVPANTAFDFASGRVTGPAGQFVRSNASGKWARIN